jgi:diacylglycerol kinase
MKLTEGDVRAVANNRYWTKQRMLRLTSAMFVALAVCLVLLALTKSSWAAIVFLPWLIYMSLELRNLSRFQKALVVQWRAEQS